MTEGEWLDLFAGPDGSGQGAKQHGIDALGIELDDAACATRKAVGARTLQADVAELSPGDFAPVVGIIASPPCPTFSSAGAGHGRGLIEILAGCMADLMDGRDTRAERREEAYQLLEPLAIERDRAQASKRAGRDPEPDKARAIARRDASMSVLVVEPLRWLLELRPEYIALEQVPPVLDLWKILARHLRELGYSAWTGLLSAERYGIPQTRERAILMARASGGVQPPRPTHQRYVKGQPAEGEFTLEGEILPWVSMAEALGWGMTARPYPVIASSRSTGGPDKEKVGGSAARDVLYEEQAAGRWRTTYERRQKGGNGVPVGPRDQDEPAPTLTAVGLAKGRDVWLESNTSENATERDADEPAPTMHFGQRMNAMRWRMRGGDQDKATRRDLDEPAPTIKGGHDAAAGRVWEPADGEPEDGDYIIDTGNTRGGTREEGRRRESDEPAPAITSRADQLERRGDGWAADRPAPTIVTGRRSDQGMLVGRQLPEGDGRNIGGANWTEGRPATTIAGDNRVHPPGHKRNAEDEAAGRDHYDGRAGENAIRVTLEEAAVLQGFPADYPFQGTRTKQFEQVGNAVPPGLAAAVIGALIE